jgi:hypothetical protein
MDHADDDDDFQLIDQKDTTNYQTPPNPSPSRMGSFLGLFISSKNKNDKKEELQLPTTITSVTQSKPLTPQYASSTGGSIQKSASASPESDDRHDPFPSLTQTPSASPRKQESHSPPLSRPTTPTNPRDLFDVSLSITTAPSIVTNLAPQDQLTIIQEDPLVLSAVLSVLSPTSSSTSSPTPSRTISTSSTPSASFSLSLTDPTSSFGNKNRKPSPEASNSAVILMGENNEENKYAKKTSKASLAFARFIACCKCCQSCKAQ